MLDSVKSVNIAAAYTANSYKTDRDLSELKDVFNEKLQDRKDVAPEQPGKPMNLDKVQLSSEALALLQTG